MSTEHKEHNTLFPVFLKLEKLNLLIVGGGNVALEKLTAVMSNSPEAKVKLVATEIFPEVKAFIENKAIPFEERPFQEADMEHVEMFIRL